MKKLMIAVLALVAMSSIAIAQQPVIGMFDDVDATICDGVFEQYVTKTIYVYAVLPQDIPAITAAEFAIANYIGDNAACAITTAIWNTTLVIGDPGWGIALAFSPALPGPLAFLGQLDVFVLDLVCLGDDYVMEIVASNDSGNLVVVDEGYNEIAADGYMFTMNCTGICLCEEGTATSESSWGSVKALF